LDVDPSILSLGLDSRFSVPGLRAVSSVELLFCRCSNPSCSLSSMDTCILLIPVSVSHTTIIARSQTSAEWSTMGGRPDLRQVHSTELLRWSHISIWLFQLWLFVDGCEVCCIPEEGCSRDMNIFLNSENFNTIIEEDRFIIIVFLSPFSSMVSW
jgi:hypothetical protein